MDLRSRWLLLFFALLTPFAALNAQTGETGTILVARASGIVTVSDPQTGTFRPLQQGMKIAQGVTVKTSDNGNALLLLSNGSAVTVKKNTTLVIDEFQQSVIPQGTPELQKLETEPSTSKTKLRLIEGDLIGTVKKLNIKDGSSYEIDSPIGTAGIRGTVWTMSVTITQDGATGNFGISVGNGFFIPLSGATQSVGNDIVINVTVGRNAQGQPVIRSIQSGQLPVGIRQEITLESEEAKKAFEALSGQEFGPGDGADVGGQNDQQQQQNRQRAQPNEPANRVTPNQGEGSTTSGPQ